MLFKGWVKKTQRFRDVFAYGCPDRGRAFDKSQTKNFSKDYIIYAINIDPLPLKWWSFWRKFPSIVEALKKTDAFHIQVSRELIAGICLFPRYS